MAKRAKNKISSLLSAMERYPYFLEKGDATGKEMEQWKSDITVLGDDMTETFGPVQRRVATKLPNSIKKEQDSTVSREEFLLCLHTARIKSRIDIFLWNMNNRDPTATNDSTKRALCLLGQALKLEIEAIEGPDDAKKFSCSVM